MIEGLRPTLELRVNDNVLIVREKTRDY